MVLPYAGTTRIPAGQIGTADLHTGYKPNRKHLRDRAAQDHPIEGMPLEQNRARHGVQAD